MSEQFDVFTFGETMIRFTPPGYERLEDCVRFDVKIGGTESNMACALARLGLRVSWASKLPRNQLGQLALRRIRGFGVDTSYLCWSDTARMGLYFIEPAVAPRAASITYDRAGSAASTMTPEDFDWALLDGVRHLHVTGITPALSAGCADTVTTAIREAKARDLSVSLDVNYRSKLWSREEAARALLPLMRQTDLLITTEDDARLLFGVDGSSREEAHQLQEVCGARRVVLTLGGEGALLLDGDEFHEAQPLPLVAIDRVGAGDAFDAGLLWGFLQDDLPKGLRYGMAMAAIKHTIPGDEFISSIEEVEAAMRLGERDIQR